MNTDRYSLWGGSAGARMAAYLGSYGAATEVWIDQAMEFWERQVKK